MARSWQVLKILATGASSASIAVWLWLMWAVTSSPLQPSSSTSQIVQYNNHGTIHFLTPLQDALLDWLIPAFFVFLLLRAVAVRRLTKDGTNWVTK